MGHLREVEITKHSKWHGVEHAFVGCKLLAPVREGVPGAIVVFFEIALGDFLRADALGEHSKESSKPFMHVFEIYTWIFVAGLLENTGDASPEALWGARDLEVVGDSELDAGPNATTV